MDVSNVSGRPGKRATELEVCSVPEPEFTKTWRPYSHQTVISATEEAVRDLDIIIKDKEYSLSKDGNNMYALWSVEEGNDKSACIGFRNSINKTMSIGYAVFFRIISCWNVMTSGNFIRLRKHTGHLDGNELKSLAKEAVRKVVLEFVVFNTWIEGLKEVNLRPVQYDAIVLRALRNGVLNSSKFGQFESLLDEREGSYNRTLYGIYGALTEIVRTQTLMKITKDNKKFTEFMIVIQKEMKERTKLHLFFKRKR